ncbi:unnamed protein product [Gongylonema pulchrum]|uniref:RuvB-like helicase n=1 Tax=Gongylonema pulchrum TaxID=637853 RepID=A0A183DE86_9BILA|nr:unnamed protein product [Gongylonema pulchrum]
MVSPHGIPSDLLDRILIIVTKPYKTEEILEIVMVRAEAEGVKLDEQAIAYLSKLGTDTSLRYVVQLLTPAKLLAQVNGRDTVTKEDVQQCAELFIDAKTSAQLALSRKSDGQAAPDVSAAPAATSTGATTTIQQQQTKTDSANDVEDVPMETSKA